VRFYETRTIVNFIHHFCKVEFHVLIQAQNEQPSEMEPEISEQASFEIFNNSESFIQKISTKFFDSTTIWDLITYTA